MVAGADGLRGLVEGIAGGGATERDQRFFTEPAGEFAEAGFIEEFAEVGWLG
jgi:hypothetical protein